MKEGTIMKCEFQKEWHNPKGGIVYYHNITLDNGDSGSIGTSSKNPEEIQVSSVLKYSIESTDRGNKIKAIKDTHTPIYSGGVGSSKYKIEPFEHKAAGMAMGYVKDLIVADKIEIKDLISSFEKIYSTILAKKVV